MTARTRFFAQKQLKEVADSIPDWRAGMVTFPFDVIGQRIAVDGYFEVDELEALRKQVFSRLPARRVCLDIGANIGNHSLFFSEDFESVYAFEPHPRTFQLLRLNAGLADNITAFETGLSSSTRTAPVRVFAGNIGTARVVDKNDPAAASDISFSLQRLDDIAEIRELPGIDFVKIDVEGHEAKAIEGGRETLSRHKPCMALEVLKADIVDGTTQAIQLLREMGYPHVYYLQSQRPFAKAPRAIGKLATTLIGLILGVRPPNKFTLVETRTLPERNHPMVLVSATPLI